MDKKFIITNDKLVAEQLIAAGFNLISTSANVWTFQNAVPKNFNFDRIDRSKFVYTNKLTF